MTESKKTFGLIFHLRCYDYLRVLTYLLNYLMMFVLSVNTC